MTEIVSVCRAWRKLSDTSEPAFLATVLGTRGSTYRRPGARLLFTRERAVAGAVSGGCLEQDLVRRGPWLARNGPWLERMESNPDEDERSGTGCQGSIDVLIEPLSSTSDAALGLVGRELDAERRVALGTVLPGPELSLGARVVSTERGLVSELTENDLAHAVEESVRAAYAAPRFPTATFRHARAKLLVELLEPPPHLFVFGAGPDVVPVARLSQLLGWNVTVCAPPGRATFRERFAGLANLSEGSLEHQVAALASCARPLALVMAHDYEKDRDALAALLACELRYLGVLGPAARTERLLSELESAHGPIPKGRREAVSAPAGLALGAETSAEIALSIVAEVQAALTDGTTAPLRATLGRIHNAIVPGPLEPLLDARA